MDLIEFTVSQSEGGARLDQLLAGRMPEALSRSAAAKLIRENRVSLDGKPCRPADKPRPGQSVALDLPEPEPIEALPEAMDIPVLYEDPDLIVVNKPPGLVVHPGPGHPGGTLVNGLLHHCGDLAGIGGKLRPGIVHRLDMDTSGALVAAKSDLAHRRLVAAFASGRVAKRYLALVQGNPPSAGSVDSPIGRHPVDRKRMSGAAKGGKPAASSWRKVRGFAHDLALLEVTIKTGRTHQIRVHLLEAGYPVLGDPVYAGRRGRKLPPGPVGRLVKEAGRQMLHAVYLAFDHPVNGRAMEFIAPLPGDFRAVLAALAQECRA